MNRNRKLERVLKEVERIERKHNRLTREKGIAPNTIWEALKRSKKLGSFKVSVIRKYGAK